MGKLFGKDFDAENLPSLEEFKQFISKLEQLHDKCGKNCIHLRRFFERIGWNWRKFYAVRKQFPMHVSTLEDEIDDELPQKQDNFNLCKGFAKFHFL